MQLTLVVPGLLDASLAALAAASAAAPALARMLGAAREPAVDDDGLVAIACKALGIARQRDWPVAPWLARGAGIDAGAGFWMCVEPATFTIGSADVRLAGVVDDLTADQGDALRSMLNAHFAGDGLRFVALEAARWLVNAGVAQALATHPPDVARDAPLLSFLPTGPDAPRWRRWHNEIQMLLFEHPLNRARESAGLAPVNGVWLWGGGTLQTTDGRSRIAMLYADAALARGLARGAGVPVAPIPRSFDALHGAAPLGAPPLSPALVWLEAIDPADGPDLARRLAAIDRDWVAPAARALPAGSLLELVMTGRGKALRFSAARPSLAQRLRAWRSAPQLSALLAPHLRH